MEVTTSFIQLIRDHPAIGYVRTNEAVDYKRYSELLEENNKLKEALNASNAADVLPPCLGFGKRMRLDMTAGYNPKKSVGTSDCTLQAAFKAVAEGALVYREEAEVLRFAAKLLLGPTAPNDNSLNFDQASLNALRRELMLYALIEIGSEDRTHFNPANGNVTRTVSVWKLTDYGRRQLAAIGP